MDIDGLTPDGALLRYIRLWEQIITPHSTGLREVLVPISCCRDPHCSGQRTWGADGKARCSRCHRLWVFRLEPMEAVQSSRVSVLPGQLAELATLEQIITRPTLWPRRAWWMFVGENVGTYEDVAKIARIRWPRTARWNSQEAEALVKEARHVVRRYLKWLRERGRRFVP